jgi:hypothetical protein
MNTLTFLLSTVIELYTMALLLRVWMQWSRCVFLQPVLAVYSENHSTYYWAVTPHYSPDGTDRQRIGISGAGSQLYQSNRAV